MAAKKAVFLFQIIMLPVIMGSNAPETQREVVLPVRYAADSRKGLKEEMRDKINQIKYMLDEVSALAEICGACDSNPCLNGGTCYEEEGGTYSCACPADWKGDRCEECNTAVGMESGKIPDNKITASSFITDEHSPSRGRLNAPGNPTGWSPKGKKKQWLQVDLDKPRNVTGIATQGGTTTYGRAKWVTKYKLQYSDDGIYFKYYKYKIQGQKKVKEFDANKDGDTVKYHELNPPIIARYVRVEPTEWEKSRIMMRMELYGCEEVKPCDSEPCLNGGNCTNEEGGNYSCKCTIGWTGDQCQNISSVGEMKDSAIVGNNATQLAQLSEWLEPVAQSGHQWKLCWRASQDGWASTTFHHNCDNKGPTVTIIKVGKYIFGGYTNVSWVSTEGYRSDPKAFLFSLLNKPGWEPLKLPQPGQKDSSYAYSVYDSIGSGPTFGRPSDLYICNEAASVGNSYANPGYSYSAPPGNSYNSPFTSEFLAGSFNFAPDEIEVFYEST